MTVADLSFDLASLRAAYASGLRPAEVIAEVYRRIEAAADPGIFISLLDRADALAAAEALGAHDPARPLWGVPVRGEGQHRRRGPADDRGLPGLRLSPGGERGRGCPACRRPGPSSSARPISTSSRPGLVGVRTPYPVPRNAIDPDAGAGRFVVRLGGRGRARHRLVRARHGYRGLGPRAGRAQPHRRAEALARRRLDARRRAGLPDARLRLRLRADGRRCPCGLRGHGRLRRRGPLLRAACPVGPVCGAAEAQDRRSDSGEPPFLRRRRGGGGLPGEPGRSRGAGLRGRCRSTSNPSTRSPTCSTRGPGSPSATPLSATSSPPIRTACTR